MKKEIVSLCVFFVVSFTGCNTGRIDLSPSVNDLVFNGLATSWDEGIPLGNAIIGALVWQKDSSLRMSLDHVGLWDLRPMVNRDSLPVRNFKWVQEQVAKKDYRPVQQMYDVPYDSSAFPTKIPGGALEFNMTGLGEVDTVRLLLNNGLCEVKWRSGARLQTFVHATENRGWFRFENVPDGFKPVLVPPEYQSLSGGVTNPVTGQDLRRLGYPQGEVITKDNTIVYRQPGSEGFYYEIAVSYQHTGRNMEGVWTIVPKPEKTETQTGNIAEFTEKALQQGFFQSCQTHCRWWKDYWKQSTVNIPDPVLAKQYYNEMYKFGAAARSYSPPVSLQAVWTADNGKLPPWKGDYHHDLNTQLSYWPCYAGNRLEEGLGYLNWLWETMTANKRYTSDYFEVEGLAVPGVATLKGEPMAGWIQYSFVVTVSAWLSQHFYLHWQYSRDRDFLETRAYPYVKEVAVFLDNISVRDEQQKRKLPISASPEIYNNSLQAWFHTTTNYDLGLIRFVYTAAIELSCELGLQDETAHWQAILDEWPDVDIDEQGALTFAKGFPYNESHRHFSNVMAFHPLGLIDWSNGERDQNIITATIKKLDEYGPDYWCGYSYSWLGNLKARALDGEGATEALRIFAEHFCLRNTFHANGDQTKQGYSKFTYRPFTLEGNMAFASGIHEMLMQSHTGTISLFPAIPASWENSSFENLRAAGAFLVSARMEDGKVTFVHILSEKGAVCHIKNPWEDSGVQLIRNGKPDRILTGEKLTFQTQPNEQIELHVKRLSPSGTGYGQIKITDVSSGTVYQTTLRDSAYLFDRAEYAVFIPEGITTLRGVFIHQHGCTMEGVGASTAYDIQYHAFAKKWGLAVISPDIFPKQGRSCHDWIDVETGTGDALIRLLSQMAIVSGHDELQTVPWLLWGHSGGGYWTLSMMKNYPERIIGVFAYSPAFDPQWEYPQTAYKIPLMIRHAGVDDFNAPGAACWQTALNTFARFRDNNGYVSLACNAGQNHNYSYVRHMAIPFYEAVLAQRLPDSPTGKLKDMNPSKTWLGDTAVYHVIPASTAKGNIRSMNWLPDSTVAMKWREYVITGAIADKTPPPAPYDLQVSLVNDTLAVITWKADADIESGIRYFNIRVKDGQTLRFPVSGDYQGFDTNGDNTIPVTLPELTCEITRPAHVKGSQAVFISTVNHAGLESLFSGISFLW